MSYAENRKAHFNYEILGDLEAGIELLGVEAKAIRDNRVSLDGAYAVVRGSEVFLLGVNISPVQPKNTPASYDPLRTRKLLLNKKEILKLAEYESRQGLTLVPLSMYNKGSKIKLKLGIAKGKKTHDKRESIKKRETDREIRRTLKEH